MRLRLLCSGLVVFAIAACSDDGLPQDSSTDGNAGTTSGGSASTSPGTSPSTASGTMGETLTSGADTDALGTSEATGLGGESTFGSETGGTAAGTGTTTEPPGTDTGTTAGDTTTGDTGTSTTDGMTTGGPDPGEVGAECMDDMDCDSGVCWDYNDYDKMCFGALCSVECGGDDECYEAFEAAGAPSPESVLCGADGRCNPMGSGFHPEVFLCF
jgi:hypothetical protein